MPHHRASPSPLHTPMGQTGRWRRGLGWTVLGLAMVLGGCASTIRLDNEVRSFAQWPLQAERAQVPTPGDTYRFERLPSQTQQREQAALEALARSALQTHGLQEAPATDSPPATRWTVQVSAAAVQWPHAPWEDPRERWPGGWRWFNRFYLSNHGGGIVLMPTYVAPPTPYHQREITLVMRDSRTAQVVYETRATHDGPWSDNPALWAALLDAALEGFPNPPAGTRRVVREVTPR